MKQTNSRVLLTALGRWLVVTLVVSLAMCSYSVAFQAGSDGTLDSTFGTSGQITDAGVKEIDVSLIDSDGKLVTAGLTGGHDVQVRRLTTGGNAGQVSSRTAYGVDPTFNGSSPVVIHGTNGLDTPISLSQF